jgi:hypothetical protein
MNDENKQQPDERYVTLATKVSRHAAEQLARIAKRKGMTIYELIQMVCDTLIRYMDDRHNLSEEMERAMSIFEHMTGWAQSLNLADPTVNKEVVQAVYIFQNADGKKKGFRAKMVNKPWMGIWEEDSNVMHIFERIFNICMPELYMKLFRARIMLECESVSEVINLLAESAVLVKMTEDIRQDFEDAARADNGRGYGYGMKTKGLQHRTPDSLATDQRIHFDDWEGEHRQTDLQPPEESEVKDD